jgi:hypothetical protein
MWRDICIGVLVWGCLYRNIYRVVQGLGVCSYMAMSVGSTSLLCATSNSASAERDLWHTVPAAGDARQLRLGRDLCMGNLCMDMFV